MRCLVSMRSFGAAAVAISLSSTAHAQAFVRTDNDEWISRFPKVSLSDLPQDVFRPIPASLPDDQIDSWLKSQPVIVLDGATLVIGQPSAPAVTALRLNRIELRGGATVVTNGSTVEISALSIGSQGGRIVSFDALEQGGAAREGTAGRPGNGGGRVIIYGGLIRNDVLNVLLPGQNGQAGGAGRKGARGAPGAPGENGADHLFDCAHGGGAGGRGNPGKTGEQGARGGSGGDGGILVLKGKIALQHPAQIEFHGDGGAPGDGGSGGPGGDGGPGGPGGGGTTYCRGGPPGPAGPPGDSGPVGQAGLAGKPGSVLPVNF